MNLAISRPLSIRDADITLLTFEVPKAGLAAHLATALAECDQAVGLNTVARQTFFIADDVNPDDLTPILERAYGWPIPATSFVNQPPADGSALACEIWALDTESPLERTPNLTLAHTADTTWGFVAGRTTPQNDPFGIGVTSMLQGVQRSLHSAGLDFGQTVRTWYYIADIVGEGDDGTPYDRFNAARNGVYQDLWPDLCRTPASTGIGMNSGDVVFEGLVLNAKDDAAQVAWLDNPLQTPPYLYDIKMTQARKPSFSRASSVTVADSVMTFISGTASIRSSEVLHIDDAVAQTEVTLENMTALVGGEGLDDLRQIRVYIKRPEDVAAVRACCRANLREMPTVYTISDVCRADCLVEIEGVHCAPSLIPEGVCAGMAAEDGIMA